MRASPAETLLFFAIPSQSWECQNIGDVIWKCVFAPGSFNSLGPALLILKARESCFANEWSHAISWAAQLLSFFSAIESTVTSRVQMDPLLHTICLFSFKWPHCLWRPKRCECKTECAQLNWYHHKTRPCFSPSILGSHTNTTALEEGRRLKNFLLRL